MVFIVFFIFAVLYFAFTSGSSGSSHSNSNSSNAMRDNDSGNSNRTSTSNDGSHSPSASSSSTSRTTSYGCKQTVSSPPITSCQMFSEANINAFPFSSPNQQFMELAIKMGEKYHLASSNSRQIVAEVYGHTVVFRYSDHSYMVDGLYVPSITQAMQMYGPNIYSNVPADVLARAAARGTAMHNTIERYEAFGISNYSPELEGYKRLKSAYGLTPIGMESIVVISDELGKPLCAGRLDFLLFTGRPNSLAIMDLKRTSTYHVSNVATQLNLYKKGFEQCFGITIDKLVCLRLREYVAEYHNVCIGDEMAEHILRCLSRNSG